MVQFPGFSRTNEPAGQPEIALVICEASSLPPPDGLRVLQRVRVGGVQGFGVVSPSGKVGCKPALPQLMARLVVRIPDHACPYESVENNSNIEIMGNLSRLIYPQPSEDNSVPRKESLMMPCDQRQNRKYSGGPPNAAA